MSAWLWLVLVWFALLGFIVWRLYTWPQPPAVPHPPRVLCDPAITPGDEIKRARTLRLVRDSRKAMDPPEPPPERKPLDPKHQRLAEGLAQLAWLLIRPRS